MLDHDTLVLRCSLAVAPERVWELWTTPAGIGAWWAPDGFRTTVDVLDLRPGGALDYTMTATGTDVVMECESLHDQVWTDRIIAGRANELDKLERLVAAAG